MIQSRCLIAAVSCCILLSSSVSSAWVPAAKKYVTSSSWSKKHSSKRMTTSTPTATVALHAQVGIYFGTSTGNTQVVAEKIYEALGSELAAEPFDVDDLTEPGQVAKAFVQHDALIVGTPTWNTGADTERSGTGWDELYYKHMPELKSVLKDKKVAVFGLGDSVSYSSNFADATGELFDVFEGLGCHMMGLWKIDDSYEHEDSKSIRGGDKFCGLLLDMINQEDLTDDRVAGWVEQLKAEGFLEASGSTTAPAETTPVVEAAAVAAKDEAVTVPEELEQGSRLMDESIGVHSTGGYMPHYNPATKRTMWTSPDGRSSYVTSDTATATTATTGVSKRP